MSEILRLKVLNANLFNTAVVKVSLSVAPELTKLKKVREEGKAIIEETEVIRGAGYQFAIVKNGVEVAVFLTKAQAAELFNPELLK